MKIIDTLLDFFQPVPPPTCWAEPKQSAAIVNLATGEVTQPARRDYPWLEGVKPLPPRTGARPKLRLVVNH